MFETATIVVEIKEAGNDGMTLVLDRLKSVSRTSDTAAQKSSIENESVVVALRSLLILHRDIIVIVSKPVLNDKSCSYTFPEP